MLPATTKLPLASRTHLDRMNGEQRTFTFLARQVSHAAELRCRSVVRIFLGLAAVSSKMSIVNFEK